MDAAQPSKWVHTDPDGKRWMISPLSGARVPILSGDEHPRRKAKTIRSQLKQALRTALTPERQALVAQALVEVASDKESAHYAGALRLLLDRILGPVQQPGDRVVTVRQEVVLVASRKDGSLPPPPLRADPREAGEVRGRLLRASARAVEAEVEQAPDNAPSTSDSDVDG